MTIAEKLQTIAENEQKVYDAGYAKGKAEGGGGGEEDMLRYCNQPNFVGLGVFDKEEVVLNLDMTLSLYRVVYQGNYPTATNTKVKHLVLNCKQQVLNVQQMMIVSDQVLDRVTLNADLSKSTSFMQMLRSQHALKVVDGTPLDLSSSTNNSAVLMDSPNVEEVRFAPNTIKSSIGLEGSEKLSDATVQSVIDGLADLTGATAQTLTLHATVKGKLTDAQVAAITAKNWTLA